MIPATMNTLKLDLERKKKSEERSFLGSYDSRSPSSSSEDEQLASDEENERMRQKGGEESDGRRPMAEQERKVSDGNNGELLLPWKVEVRDEIRPRALIEEISVSKQQYIADDAERKSHEKRLLDNCKKHGPIDDVVDRETAVYREVASKSETEKEEAADLQKSTDNNNETNDRKNGRTSTCSVSCDTSDLKQTLEEDKLTTTVTNVRDDTSSKNNRSYQRKSKEYPFSSKLSSIREEMREFCNSIDRFVDENKIVFKNGKVEGFWGERKMVDENLQTDFVDDVKIEETRSKVFASEEDKLRWWNIKERKLKVKEILKKREDEAKENKIEAEDTEINEKFGDCSSEDKKQSTDITNNFQDTYDLTPKTCSSVLPDSTEVYSIKDAEHCDCEQSAKVQQEESRELFSSIFAESRNRDCAQKINKPKISTELMILEEKLDYEKSDVDTREKNVSTLINAKNLVDCNEQSLKCENIVEQDNSTKIDILKNKVNNLSFESSEGKKNIDESDDDSFKSATSVQEDSQILEGNYESSGVLRSIDIENNFDKIIDSIKNENIDQSIDNHGKEIILSREHNDAICEDEKINGKSEISSNKIEISKTEQEFSEIEQSDFQRRSLTQMTDRLSLEKASHSSKLTGKRIREAEDIEVSNKKSFLEEINPGRKPEERKSRSQVSERCRQHLIQETKKFAKKVSPLIDKCITNLIKETKNPGEQLQCHKYNRSSLGEYLPFDCVSKMDLNKTADNFEERDNCRDNKKSNDVTNTCSEKQELIQEQTINSQSVTSTNQSDIQSLANLLRQSVNCKSELPAANTNVSLYKEFCDHLYKLESEKKLLIKPDFTMNRQKSEEMLSDDNLQKTECSIKKSVKPLIEVISKHPTTSKEQTSEQTEIERQSHSSQTSSCCQQKDAVFRKSEEPVEISDDFENHINQESAINLKEGIKVETFLTSCTVENIECKEECVSSNEECKIVTTNVKKSIEMQVAQEN